MNSLQSIAKDAAQAIAEEIDRELSGAEAIQNHRRFGLLCETLGRRCPGTAVFVASDYASALQQAKEVGWTTEGPLDDPICPICSEVNRKMAKR